LPAAAQTVHEQPGQRRGEVERRLATELDERAQRRDARRRLGADHRANALGEAYGSDRLKEASARSRGDNARIALYSLLGEVQGWADGVAPEDDMTLVVAKVL
jgi:hypothetical protein